MHTIDWSGNNLVRDNPFDDDLLAHIYGREQDLELELFATKWFDYRHMTPAQATRLYIAAYTKVYRQRYAMHMDAAAAPHVRVRDLDWMLEVLRSDGHAKQSAATRMFKSCWRGRQTADAIGMPYETYLDLAFEYRLRFWKQRHLPQPQHLFGEADVEKILDRWEEMQKADLWLSSHPAYLVQNYQGISYQNDYHEWLFKQANNRSNPPEFLARFIREDVLPFDKVAARLGEQDFERVQSWLN